MTGLRGRVEHLLIRAIHLKHGHVRRRDRIDLQAEIVHVRLVAELDGQQKKMVQKLLKDLTSPFRAFDVEEVQECLKEAGGADKLRLTYYKDGDIGNDKVWDIWKLEGPAFAWYFHGSPHVHTWVNIARKAPQA